MTDSSFLRDRRAFLVLSGASALLLSGCGDLLGPPPAPQIYLLDAAAMPAPAAAAQTAPQTGWSLALIRPTAPGTLNSERIALVQADATMDYYANAQYPDSLPSVVETALLNAFEKTGALAGVGRESEALHADYDLFTDIKAFEARYSAPDSVPQTVVTLTARLATAHGRIIVATTTVTQTVPAGANSVGAVVAALQQGLGAAVSGIVTWALTFPVPSTQNSAPH